MSIRWLCFEKKADWELRWALDHLLRQHAVGVGVTRASCRMPSLTAYAFLDLFVW